MGDGFLVVREEAAIAGPVPAEPETIWDGRFRLVSTPVAGAEIGKLGDDSARVRQYSSLPAAVLRTLPAVRRGKKLAAVPHLHYVPEKFYPAATFVFAPRKPMAGADFVPM
jgi:tRNA(Ile)-lysidine synthase